MVEHASELRLAIAGGGTGGHVLPALAVVDELRQRGVLADLIWIGSRDGVERRAAEEESIQFIAIPTGKLRRYLSLRNLTDAARIPLGVLAARRALASVPPGRGSEHRRVCQCPGCCRRTRHRSRADARADGDPRARQPHQREIRTTCSLSPTARPECSRQRLHRRVVVTGNPIRVGLTAGDRSRGLQRLGFEPNIPVVYVTGGARGASPINQRIAALLPGILDRAQIVHQTGPASANADAGNLTERRESLPEAVRHRYHVVEFLRDELPDVYAAPTSSSDEPAPEPSPNSHMSDCPRF